MSSWMSPADPEPNKGKDSSFAMQTEVWTVQRVLNWSAGWLKEKAQGKDSASTARLDAELILAHVLGCDRMRLYLDLDRPLSKEERDSFKVLLRRRADEEPIAYILGYRDFYRHRFEVNSSVLIPRSDTEILVEEALKLLTPFTSPAVLDVGTGSGCIALALALAKPDAQVTAWEISKEALVIAERNKAALSCQNLQIELCDVRTALPQTSYEMIVSNPPYIARSEEPSLSASVKSFEPHVALFDDVAADGLSFYRILAEKALAWLAPQGVLIVECGHTQAKAVGEIFTAASSSLGELTITKYLGGKDRIVSVRRI